MECVCIVFEKVRPELLNQIHISEYEEINLLILKRIEFLFRSFYPIFTMENKKTASIVK